MSSFPGPLGIAQDPPDPPEDLAEVGVALSIAEEQERPAERQALEQERHGRPSHEELVVVIAAEHDLLGPGRPWKRLGQGPRNLQKPLGSSFTTFCWFCRWSGSPTPSMIAASASSLPA
jgi:hypothetical protein